MIVAFSGGKDSTALALHLHEIGESFEMIYTATGNELPPVAVHIENMERILKRPVEKIPAPTLGELIEKHQCLPSWRMRFCTRQIKIEPCRKFLDAHPDTLCVGLRADEEARAGGTYGAAMIRYPLREWNWGLDEVLRCCERYGVMVPARTDCAVCFFQTLHDWWSLWWNWPKYYAQGEQWEEQIGHTFRSPKRDRHPASLRGLRQEFEAGYEPKKRGRNE